jgi:hypothetical protein
VALDLDGDGLHDRIYAGDLASRLWRFDLHHGAAAAAWASGGILADFSSPAGRAFVAAPDVSLSTSTGDSWFNIAIGTASLPGSSAGNRFYVLRDHAPFEAWSDADYARWTPLRERDLVHLAAPAQAALQSIQHGYFIELAHGDVLMPSLTVAGRAVLASSDSPASTATQCRVAISVAALELDSALDASVRTSGDSSRSWREILPGAVPIDAQFQLGTTNRGEALCTLGNAPVTACVVDTQPVKTWWLRGDAE